MAFKHEPLGDPDSEIRIATLQPGSFDEDLKISFQTKRLKGDAPDFEALSYVWGSVENPSHVQIQSDGNHTLTITQNLEIALRHLRFLNEPREIWVDALCINQHCVEEKNHQVALMGDIYSLASNVIIWLGPEKDNSNKALTLMASVCQEVEVDWNTEDLRPSKYCTNKDWADYYIPLPYVAGELIPVAALFERPYFTRAWIRQEIVRATEATVYCGSMKMPWKDFRTAAVCLRAKTCNPEAIGGERWPGFSRSRIEVFNLCRLLRRQFSLSTLPYFQGPARCQDPRDRIYSFLGLLSRRDSLLNIVPDYDLPVGLLCQDIARRILVSQHSLNFLQLCHSASNTLQLPSWTPDWTVTPVFDQQISSQWSACAWISAHAHVEGNQLSAYGIARARVETVKTLNDCDEKERASIALHNLRQIKPMSGGIIRESREWRDTVLKYCLLFNNYYISDYYTSPMPFLTAKECMRLLDLIWSSEEDVIQLSDDRRGGKLLLRFLSQCWHVCIGRSFFMVEDGYIGLGPANITDGDIICVLLGSQFPIAIRLAVRSQKEPRWQIVGPVLVPGLMHGETIYRHSLPAHYEPKEVAKHESQALPIDGQSYAMHDRVKDIFIFDPAEVLEEACIKVEKYERDPHVLEVLPASLRGASIALEKFVFV